MPTKILKIIILWTLQFGLLGCNDKQKVTNLQNKISDLEKQLDACSNGAEKLLSRIKIAFKDQNYKLAKEIIYEFKERHPESKEFNEAQLIYEQLVKIENEKITKEKSKAEEEKTKKDASFKKLKKNFDDVTGTTWFSQPYYKHFNNTNLISIYLGDNGQDHWLRLFMSYAGEDWIFFNKAYLSYDGKTREVVFNEYQEKKSENDGGQVWEWIDVAIEKELATFLWDFAKSKNAKMRLAGKYTRTRTLSNKERQGILDILYAYEKLESKK